MLSSVEESNMFKILKRLLKKSDVENKSLSDEYLEIVRKFGELGIRIQDIKTLEVSVWEIIYKSLVSLYKKYPEVSEGFIREINFNKISNGAAMTYFPMVEPNCYDTTKGVFIALNKHYFLNVEKFKNILHKTGLPYEAGYEFTIAHEFGHIIEFNYCIKNKLIPFGASISEDDILMVIKNLPISKEIVNAEIVSLYPKRNPSNISIEGVLSELIDCVASIDAGEAFAEAIAFDYFSIDNILVKKIINHYKSYISKN